MVADMKVIWLFLHFTGRIPRQSYWLGFATVVAVFGLGRYVLKYHLGATELAVVVWSTLAAIPLAALSVKRFNDRDRPTWFGYAVGAATALFIAAPYFGYLTDDVAQYSFVEHVLLWGSLPLSVAALVDNGFLRGTRGENRHGPDPIGDGA